MYLQEAELDKLSFHSLYMVMCDVQSEATTYFTEPYMKKKETELIAAIT